jgi:hypothetical protein
MPARRVVDQIAPAGPDQPHAFCRRKISNPRRFDRPEWLHPAPRVVTRNVTRFPCVVERSFQYRQNSICSGAALARAIGGLVGLAMVRFVPGLGTGECQLAGKAAVPVLDFLRCQLADRYGAERRKDMRLGGSSGVINCPRELRIPSNNP